MEVDVRKAATLVACLAATTTLLLRALRRARQERARRVPVGRSDAARRPSAERGRSAAVEPHGHALGLEAAVGPPDRVREELGWSAVVPHHGEQVLLD